MDYSPLPFNHSGACVEVTMHADAGKVVSVTAPAWVDTIWVRFYEASTAPPTPPVDTSGWVGVGKTAGDLIGVDALHVKDGEAAILERKEARGTWVIDLACETAAGIAQLRFERAGR